MDRLLSDVGKERHQGNFERAESLLRAELEVQRQKTEQDSLLQAELIHELAVTHLEAGDIQQARIEAEWAFEIRRHVLGSTAQLQDGKLLLTLARIHERSGEDDVAQTCYKQAISVYDLFLPEDVQFEPSQPHVFSFSRPKYDFLGVYLWQTCLRGINHALNGLYRLHEGHGRYKEALSVANEQVDVRAMLRRKDDAQLVEAISARARIHVALGDTLSAIRDLQYGESLLFDEKTGTQPWEFLASLYVASVWLSLDRYDRADALIGAVTSVMSQRIKEEAWHRIDSVATAYLSELQAHGRDVQADSMAHQLSRLHPNTSD